MHEKIDAITKVYTVMVQGIYFQSSPLLVYLSIIAHNIPGLCRRGKRAKVPFNGCTSDYDTCTCTVKLGTSPPVFPVLSDGTFTLTPAYLCRLHILWYHHKSGSMYCHKSGNSLYIHVLVASASIKTT